MKQEQPAGRVSAAEFVRSFSNWRVHAAPGPVVVTHHGKDAHVLISLDDYRQMGAAERPADTRLRDSEILLLESIRDGLLIVDRERHVALLNPAASDMFETSAASAIGRSLIEVLPRIETSCIYPHIVRMIEHRERYSAELPSLLRPGQWLRVDLVPLPIGGAMMLRDVTELVGARASASAQQAAIRAIDVDAGIGRALITVRGMVEDANDALSRMTGASAEAIRRVRFAALLTLEARHSFSEALEALFRTGTAARLESEMVTRDGTILPVTLSIVEHRGTYGSEGAAVLATPYAPLN